MRCLFTILIFLFASCNSNPTESHKDPKQAKKETVVPSHDSIYNTPSIATNYKISTDRPLRQVANLILIDSILPLDNEVTFNCMDSLTSENSDTREFYFPVFNKIVDKSDGALSEIVGQYIMRYVREFPKDFAIRSKSLKEEEFKNWAFYVAYEMHFDYETPQKAQEWMRNIISNCKECDSEQIKRLQEFNEVCISSMKVLAED